MGAREAWAEEVVRKDGAARKVSGQLEGVDPASRSWTLWRLRQALWMHVGDSNPQSRPGNPGGVEC